MADRPPAAVRADIFDRPLDDPVRRLSPDGEPTDIFADAYEEPTPRVAEQRAWFEGLRDRHDDGELIGEDLQ